MVLFYKANGKREIPMPKEEPQVDDTFTQEEEQQHQLQQEKDSSSGGWDLVPDDPTSVEGTASSLLSMASLPQTAPTTSKTGAGTGGNSKNNSSVSRSGSKLTPTQSAPAAAASSGEIVEMR